MNEIINRFFLAGDKFMPEISLRKPGFMLVDNLLEKRKKCKKIKKQKTEDIFIKTNWTKPAFNMI